MKHKQQVRSLSDTVEKMLTTKPRRANESFRPDQYSDALSLLIYHILVRRSIERQELKYKLIGETSIRLQRISQGRTLYDLTLHFGT